MRRIREKFYKFLDGVVEEVNLILFGLRKGVIMRKEAMNKMFLFLAVVLLGIGGIAQAITIEWLARGDIGTWDDAWISLLESQGYTVSLQPGYYETLDAAKLAELNSRDLIIAARTLRAARYDDGDEPEQWSNLATPLLCLDATATDTTDWDWFNPGSSTTYGGKMEVLNPSHPFFAGVTLDANNQVDFIAGVDVDIPTETSAGNGTLLATTVTGELIIAEWDAGVQYYSGGPFTTGGPRVFFGAGANLGDGGAGGLNLDATGQQIFLNIVYEMLNSDYDRPPAASAPDGIANVGVASQIDATAFDFEGAPLTIVWSQLDGPAAATFSDTGIEDPTVTFPAGGTYTLQISVNDGTNPPATDTGTFYVWDTADNALVGHWDFESLPDPNTLTDITGNGFTGIWASTDGGDPNVTTGNNLVGATTNTAFDGSFEDGYWEVPNALVGAGDPNFNDVKTGTSFATWIKMPSGGGNNSFPVVAAFGNSSSRMQIRANDNGKVTFAGAGGEARSSRGVMDDLWHHVVGVFDGPNAALKVYIDGVKDDEASTAPGTIFSPDPELRIGNRVTARHFFGAMDDLQIYNYPLSDAEIATLTAAGDVPVYVTAGDDQDIFFKNQPVALDGTLVVDDGTPAPATLLWELTGYPLGVNPVDIVINSPTAVDTTVTFPNPPVEGVYTFTLTGDDTATTSSDSVVITMIIPTCADVIADGLTNPMDFNTDCKVDILDFAAFAAEWLDCVDPKGGVGCVSPY